MIRIDVLALPGCVASSVTGPLDVFAAANFLAAREGRPEAFAARLVATKPGPVASFHGLPVTPHGLAKPDDDCDAVIVPALIGGVDQAVSDTAALAYLRARHERGAVVCAVCAGVFTLAETGLLDGREATTHWALAEVFNARYPRVRLTPERLLCDTGDLITAGGVTAYLDLCLHLVARFCSRESAAGVAKTLLLDPGRRSQEPYAEFGAPRGHGDAAVLRAQDWLEIRLAESVSLPECAKAAGLGERTLLRRFRKATGDTPHAYLTRLRIEKAKLLLETTDRTVDDLAYAVGYADACSFRAVFKTRCGLTPGEYRRRFSVMR